MLNIKIISLFSAFGFLLSFLFGLFSHNKIYIILIKALIFAVIFALIGLAISFVYSKFLKGDSSEPENTSDNNANQNFKGQNVDIVVNDQELERSDSPNSFEVGDSFQMLNPSDVGGKISSNDKIASEISKANETAVEHNTIGEQFIPMNNFQKVEKATVESDNSANQSTSSSPVTNNNSESFITNGETGVVSDELDTLPDLGGLSVQKADGSSTSDEESSDGSYENSSSDFTSDSSFSSSRRNTDENIEIKDASLMAKAISSILSGEES